MDDDGGERSIGDVEEDGRKGVKGEEDNNAGDQTSERSANASLRLDGRAREGAGRL